MNSRRIPIFLLTLALLLSMVVAAYPDGASSQTGPTKTATVDVHMPTIQAQQTTVAELKGTATARGKKINAQRTQIAELKTQVATYKPEPTNTPRPRPTNTPVPTGLTINDMIEDAIKLETTLSDFVSSGGDTDIGLGMVKDIHRIFNRWEDSRAPAGYVAIHDEWMDYITTFENFADIVDGIIAGTVTKSQYEDWVDIFGTTYAYYIYDFMPKVYAL